MSEFKIGDVVQLNCGGPAMTVGGIGADANTIACLWFGIGDEPHNNSYPAACLTLAQVPPPAPAVTDQPKEPPAGPDESPL